MKLNATVTRMESASTYPDQQQRVVVRLDDGGQLLSLRNEDGRGLDERVVVLVMTERGADFLRTDLERVAHDGVCYSNRILEQLRPDSPPLPEHGYEDPERPFNAMLRRESQEPSCPTCHHSRSDFRDGLCLRIVPGGGVCGCACEEQGKAATA